MSILSEFRSFVLQAQWSKMEKNIIVQMKAKIQECMPKLTDGSNAKNRLIYIINNMDEPWGHPTLKRIMHEDRQPDAAGTNSEKSEEGN